MIDCFLFSFDFVVEVSSASFCSNPDALGFDESEKGIFGSLKNITQLPPGSPKEGNRVADFAAGRRKIWSPRRIARSLLPLALVSGLI